jgi:hypothetical protein
MNPIKILLQTTIPTSADDWSIARFSAPSFVDEPPGDAIMRDPLTTADTRRDVCNLALWLAGRTG